MNAAIFQDLENKLKQANAGVRTEVWSAEEPPMFVARLNDANLSSHRVFVQANYRDPRWEVREEGQSWFSCLVPFDDPTQVDKLVDVVTSLLEKNKQRVQEQEEKEKNKRDEERVLGVIAASIMLTVFGCVGLFIACAVKFLWFH